MTATAKPKISQINMVSAGTAFAYPDWLTGAAYTNGQVIKRNFTLYMCFAPHTAGTFATDWLTNSYWVNLTDAPGTIKHWSGSNVPAGYLACDGTATVLKATYPELWAVVGTLYGTATSTQFTLPNSKGRTLIGAGQGLTYADGSSTTGTNFTIASASGREKHIIASTEIASHTHNIPAMTTGGQSATHNHSASLNNAGLVSYSGSGGSAAAQSLGSNPTVSVSIGNASADHSHNTPSTTSGGAGSDTAHNNMQPYLVVNHIIKY